jgi:ketosteroid isomerase-like protein
MTTQEETRKVVEAYFAAWRAKDAFAALSLLSQSVKFSGPTGPPGSGAFSPALVSFATMSEEAQILALVVEGDRAALLYSSKVAEPVGTLKIASFFRVEKGKIAAYDVVFDSAELRRFLVQENVGVHPTPVPRRS